MELIYNKIMNKTPLFNPIDRIYLFHGKEDAYKNFALNQIIREVIDENSKDFDAETLDGDNLTSEKLISAASMAPFLSKRRVIVVKNAEKIKEAEGNTLEKNLEKIPSSAVLVLISMAQDESKKRKSSLLSSKLDSKIRKIGTAVDFQLFNAEEVMGLVNKMLVRHKKKITRGALIALVEAAGSNLSHIRQEIEKLVAYTLDSDTITEKDVDILVHRTPEAKVFSLVDAIGARQEGQAIAMLENIFASGERPDKTAPQLLALISRQFRLIYQARFLLDINQNPANYRVIPDKVKDVLPDEPNIIRIAQSQSFLISKLIQQAKRYSPGLIAKSLERILETELSLKGIEGNVEDSRLGLELLVIDLCRIKAKE